MKSVLFVMGIGLLLFRLSSGLADSCSDMQAAIAKAAVLKNEMQREARPLFLLPQLPSHHDGVCTAAQNLRNHIVLLAGHIDVKCLNEEQHKILTNDLASSMKDASSNIGLFCH